MGMAFYNLDNEALCNLMCGKAEDDIYNDEQEGDEIMSNLRQAMINYRAKERITQAELGDRSGLTREYINSIETGKVVPSPITEARIRIAIGAEKEA